MLRVAFFGSEGVWSTEPLQSIAKHHQVALIVRAMPGDQTGAIPTIRRSLRAAASVLGMTRPGPLESTARGLKVPCWSVSSGHDPWIAEELTKLELDLICIAGFPWILDPHILMAARLGAVNLHGSLLPRHRGILPLFWIYYHDDRETGVTVHWAESEADAGDIILQDRFPLPRGFPVDRLNQLNAESGARIFPAVLDAIARGDAPRAAQDERRVTHAPRPPEGVAVIDFAEWDVERVWHFTAGLFPRFRERLTDQQGRLIRYEGVSGFHREEHGNPPGTVLRVGTGFDLYCRGGVVHLRGKTR